MPTLPAVSRAWHSRINIPYEDTTSQLNLARSYVFSLFRCLIDTQTGGTATNSRAGTSIWTVRGSSNGTSSFSVSGVNHIAARTNLVWAAVGANHSWMWLENTTLGYQIVIDCIDATNTNISLRAASAATGAYTGGSLTNAPTSAEDFVWSSTTATASEMALWMSDVTTGGTQNTHFAVAANGEFQFFASRAGQSRVHVYMALAKTTGGPAGDVRNVFLIGGSLASARGMPSANALATPAGCSGRNPNGVATMTQGGIVGHIAAGLTLYGNGSGFGADSITGLYNSVALQVWGAVAGSYSYRGLLPDMYTVTPGVAVATSIPSAAAMTRTVLGDIIVPLPSTVALVV